MVMEHALDRQPSCLLESKIKVQELIKHLDALNHNDGNDNDNSSNNEVEHSTNHNCNSEKDTGKEVLV